MIDLNKRKILIVDDVPTNITVLTEILMADYKMVCATNGRDALKLATSSFPDLILLDIMMPEMNGFDVAAVLKNQPDIEFMVEGHTDNVPYRSGVLLDNWPASVGEWDAFFKDLYGVKSAPQELFLH